MQTNATNLVLRWSIGDFDTTTRSDMRPEKLSRFIKMAKLSIYSFQQFFDAEFILAFNGSNWPRFQEMWDKINPQLKELTFINQHVFKNPYSSFFPLSGVWWKWIPFRYDENRTEISIDTDIICINSPNSWYKWLNNDCQTLVPKEAIPEICESTCGDVWQHPIIHNKRALNCGIIGQKNGTDLTERFFKLTELVDYGSYNGNFVTEQGLFNILFYSLENEGVENYYLPYEQNLQARHLQSALAEGVEVETIHFTAKSKNIFYDLYDVIRDKVDQKISSMEFLFKLTEWYLVQ